MEENTTIALKKSTRDRLKKYGKKGDSWNTLLNELMDEVDMLNSFADCVEKQS
jgi:hypothetical protein